MLPNLSRRVSIICYSLSANIVGGVSLVTTLVCGLLQILSEACYSSHQIINGQQWFYGTTGSIGLVQLLTGNGVNMM
jgi:hypothetical protein